VKIRSSVIVMFLAVVTIAALLPAPSYAQRRAVVRARGGARVGVVVGTSYYRPIYYRPYYYRPYFYDPYVYGGWYYGYYPSAWQYPYYGGYRYDMSGSLRLQVEPREAEVFVDGYYAGTVDNFDGMFQRLHLEPGQHDLELYLPGHRSFTQKVYLQPGQTFRVRHEMQALGAGEPEPARPQGIAPAPQQAVQGPPSRRPAPVARQPRGPVTAQAAASDYGSISLRVQPGEAEIRIDGERWEGPSGDERLSVQLSAGRHVVDIQKPGYRQYTTEVTVRSGETVTLNVALTAQ
jgi:hypothetical protein